MSERIENNSAASLIGFCGADCGECKAFIATKKNDSEMKKAIVEEWSKQLGVQLKPEDMTCVGCAVVDGPHVGYCAVCKIRTCGVQKKVQNCGYCLEYGCDKLKVVHDRSPKAKAQLEEIQKLTKKK
ncbi:MAG: DUF3795 domain-containing protein [Candidatus Bathyarchaeia archaeon]|jgi:hypothetical protein